MPRTLPPRTPTRRSKRFQPLATPSTKPNKFSNLSCSWASEPVFVRRTNSELDLLLDEQSTSSKNVDSSSSDEGDDVDEDEEKRREDREKRKDALQTVFYSAFQMKPKATLHRRGQKDEPCVYNVGDTVLIETDTFYRVKKPPSVAVIVALWETRLMRTGEEEEEEEEAERVSDPSKMRMRVHWFLRPTELASIRAKREHVENEIYYTLSSREILTPDVIISKCTVSSLPPNKQLQKRTTNARAVSGSPSKRTGGWVFEGIPPSDHEEEEDDELLLSNTTVKVQPKYKSNVPSKSSTAPVPSFYCHLAVDSYRGLYYGLDWDAHRAEALEKSSHVPSTGESDDEVGEDDPEVDQWGSGTAWEAEIRLSSKAKGKGKEKTKSDRRPKKRVRRDEGDAESESSEEEEDEFEASSDEEDEDDELAIIHEEENEDSPLSAISDDDENEVAIKQPRTPSKKKRKRASSATVKTPRRPKRPASGTLVHPTPHSKARARRGRPPGPASPSKKRVRSFPVPPPTGLATLDLTHLPADPWLRAMHALHVGSRPDALPCREEEYTKVLRCVGELLEEGSGGCVYISGVPGTGKTATVHTIVRELKRMAEAGETNPFAYVEINGLKIPEPAAAYSLLWEGVSGHDVGKEGHLKISAKESLKALTRHFVGGGARGPGGHACVVLMDELDQLVTVKQDVVYNFFNWPTLVESKLVVIAVANTMDLPERVMTGRVRSRLGMIRINFQPYSTTQLQEIVHARLQSMKEGLEGDDAKQVVLNDDAIKLAAMRVGAVSGDARRVLDICRRAVELVHSRRRTAGAPQIMEVTSVMQKSPTAAYLRDCTFHERMMLASLVKCMKREGVECIKWEEVQHQHLVYMNVLTGPDDPSRKPTPNELAMVVDSLAASHALIIEASSRKADGKRGVMLQLEQGEVERVLSEVGGARWKNMLSG